MNPSNPLVLLETADFELRIGELSIVPEYLQGKTGYQIINKRTQVVEQEGNCEGSAIRALYDGQAYLDKILKDPKGENEPKEQSLEDFLAGMDGAPKMPGEFN